MCSLNISCFFSDGGFKQAMSDFMAVQLKDLPVCILVLISIIHIILDGIEC